MAAETQYTANTGLVQISGANTSLTGSGTLGSTIYTLITGSTTISTLVKSITVKATGTTAEGMVRIFMYDGTNTNLIQEIHVPANVPSATNPAFEYTWNCNFMLKPGVTANTLRVTTQIANTFNVIADGLDWTYFTGAVRPESTNFTAHTGSAVVSVLNPNLNGTGTLATVITASSGGLTWNGLRLESVTVKARVTTTMGMVRLFIYDGTNTRLFKEIPIPAITQSATEKTFETTISLGDFNLKFASPTAWEIRASTEKAESIAVTIQGQLWKYPPASTISNFTPASGTAVTTEELLHSLSIPAGLFSTGDVMRVCATFVMLGSGSKNFRIYVNTTSSLSGATKLATVTYTTETSGSIMRLFPVISATSLGAFGGATQSVASQYDANAGTTANITVPTTASAFFVLISGQKATAGDTDTVQWSIAQKDNTYSL